MTPATPGMPRTDVVDEVRALDDAATAADSASALSEQTWFRLRADAAAGPLDETVHHVVRADDGLLLAYAQLADHSAELVVHPGHRHQGVGTTLVRTLLDLDDDVRLWSHSDHPDAARIAATTGLSVLRELWEMARPLDTTLPVAPSPPEGVRIRTFHPGADDDAWVALNATAFADHPEQGRLTVDDLRARMAEPWFDPAGFFLAVDDDRLLAFHWTKVHDDDPPVGEVYVVGVDPAEQGRGLGRLMTLIGLHHLRDRGLDTVTLFVDESNTAAVATYTRLGFARTASHQQFGRHHRVQAAPSNR
jgi:mycothiol synthase